MKICLDNLEGVYLGKTGTFRKGRNTYYEGVCVYCKQPALLRKGEKFCSISCGNSMENHNGWKDGISLNRKDWSKAYNRKWNRENKGRKNALTRKREALKMNQLPDDANLVIIDWYYFISQQMSERIGIPGFYHVDHIKPLSKGGLHHEDNLQILTARQNLMKGDMYPN